MLSLCKQGDHVLMFAEMYQPTRYMVRRVLSRYGIAHTMLSIEDIGGIERTLAARPTRLDHVRIADQSRAEGRRRSSA